MKTKLTLDQIQHHQNQGWTVVENFLSVDELRELSDAVEFSVRQMKGLPEKATKRLNTAKMNVIFMTVYSYNDSIFGKLVVL